MLITNYDQFSAFVSFRTHFLVDYQLPVSLTNQSFGQLVCQNPINIWFFVQKTKLIKQF